MRRATERGDICLCKSRSTKAKAGTASVNTVQKFYVAKIAVSFHVMDRERSNVYCQSA